MQTGPLFSLYLKTPRKFGLDTANYDSNCDPYSWNSNFHNRTHHMFACTESQLVLIIDPSSKRAVDAISNPFDGGDHQPEDFWGPAGDGHYYGSWIKPDDPWWG